MTVEWYQSVDPTNPLRGWRRAVGRVQSDWNIGEHFFDAWVAVGVDLVIGVPLVLETNVRQSTFFVTVRHVVDSRPLQGKSAVRYEGLSEKFKYGEACIEEDGVRAGVAYLNFSRQYLCSSQFYSPNVTRARFTDTLPLVSVQAEWITFNDTGSSAAAISTSTDYAILSGVRMRGYDEIETRVTSYYLAGLVNSFKPIGAPLPISVFAL